ncbi:MAG: hypothetical protein WD176_09595, partial [Pirellulales bacterium]
MATRPRGSRPRRLAAEALERRDLLTDGAADFPIKIIGDQFVVGESASGAFVNLISYSPLEPGQGIADEIRVSRIVDDLRRWQSYRGGSDLIALRVYPQPSDDLPQRMPTEFYDGLRTLDFFVVRDIYFDEDYTAFDAIARGHAAIDRVINEVAMAGAFDRIFSWEIGNEFVANGGDVPVLEAFLTDMVGYIKAQMTGEEREDYS